MNRTLPKFALFLAAALTVWLAPSIFGGKVLLPVDVMAHTPPYGEAGPQATIMLRRHGRTFMAGNCGVYARAAMRCIYRGTAAGSASDIATTGAAPRGRRVRSKGI